jgi:hypothetical protein
MNFSLKFENTNFLISMRCQCNYFIVFEQSLCQISSTFFNLMKNILITLTLLGALSLLSVSAASSTEQAVGDAYMKYNKAIHDGDLGALKPYLAEKTKLSELENKGNFELTRGMTPKEIKVIEMEMISGGGATLRVKGSLFGETMSGTVAMVLIEQQWKVSKERWEIQSEGADALGAMRFVVGNAYLQYNKAIHDRDLGALKPYVAKKKTLAELEDKGSFESLRDMRIKEIKVIKVILNPGEGATLYVEGSLMGTKLSGTVGMVLIEQQWKVSSEQWGV